MRWIPAFAGALACAFLLGPARAQPAAADKDKYVSREEYEKLLKEMQQMRSELETLKKQQAPPTTGVSQSEFDSTVDDLEKKIRAIKDAAKASGIGQEKFILTGYGIAEYINREGENSTFNAQFNPIFDWKLTSRLMFEGELEIAFEDEEAHVDLEYANISYVVNNYIVVGGGKFLLPFAQFNERLHPAWINKLPDKPMAFADGGIAPEADIGAYIRGGFPIGSTRWNYAIYVSNGPGLITDDRHTLGQLDFENFSDNNDNKAVGGRIGFLPIPELEVGYSFQYAKVNPNDFGESVYTYLQAVDLSYKRQVDWLKGTIDLRAEWVFSDVERATYAVDSDRFRFLNNRNGGYAQIAYRPTLAGGDVLKNLEFVFRYDALFIPDSAPGAHDEQRYTFGVDYWLSPSMVIKLAYQIDDREDGDDHNALFVQAAIGF